MHGILLKAFVERTTQNRHTITRAAKKVRSPRNHKPIREAESVVLGKPPSPE